MQLVFSDEFNTEKRTFSAGDDQHWEELHQQGPQLHTTSMTTVNGSLEISLSKPEFKGFYYYHGMLTSWNKVSGHSELPTWISIVVLAVLHWRSRCVCFELMST